MDNNLYKNTSLLEIGKKIFSLALPMAGTQLINISSGFLCMAMLARLGHQVLAASALIFSTQMSIMVSGMSILFSLSVLVGRAYGAKEYSTIGNFVQQSWMLALLISMPVMVLFWNIGPILVYFDQPIEIVKIVQTYFHAYVWAVLPGLLAVCNQQLGYGAHKKMLMSSISFISVFALLITAYLLIFGKYAFPHLGVAGLGYATAIQYGCFFIISTLCFYYKKEFTQFEIFQWKFHQHINQLALLLKLGWPICIQMSGEMLSFFVSGIMIGWLGTAALAAFQIVNQYYCLIIIPIFAMSQASGILVGHACGAREFWEIRKIGKVSMMLVFAVSLIAACVFLLFPKTLASFYMQVNNPLNAPTLHVTILLFSICAFSQIFDSLRNILVGMSRGLLDTRFPMMISLLSIWVIGMPLSYLLAFSLHFGAGGFVFGGMIGMLGSALILIYRWHTLSNIKMNSVDVDMHTKPKLCAP
jgi:MATE family multidrug resistance protein